MSVEIKADLNPEWLKRELNLRYAELDRLRGLAQFKATCAALDEADRLRRELNDTGPGTPLGRLTALAEYAVSLGLCTGVEAKPPELFLVDEIHRLRRDDERLRAELEVSKPLYSRRLLEAERDRLRAALDFYADEKTWGDLSGDIEVGGSCPGAKARKALANEQTSRETT